MPPEGAEPFLGKFEGLQVLFFSSLLSSLAGLRDLRCFLSSVSSVIYSMVPEVNMVWSEVVVRNDWLFSGLSHLTWDRLHTKFYL